MPGTGYKLVLQVYEETLPKGSDRLRDFRVGFQSVESPLGNPAVSCYLAHRLPAGGHLNDETIFVEHLYLFCANSSATPPFTNQGTGRATRPPGDLSRRSRSSFFSASVGTRSLPRSRFFDRRL